MADNKLISMVDYIDRKEESNIIAGKDLNKNYFLFGQPIRTYKNFIKQPIELWMFIPCKLVDGVWVVLEEPFNDGMNDQYYSSAMEEYQEAKANVIFEGIELKEDMYKSTKRKIFKIGDLRIAHELIFYDNRICFSFDLSCNNETIEGLVKYNLTLTQHTAEKLNL